MPEKEPELLKPLKPERRFQPMAGFWLRTAALMLDLIFLRFFLYALVFIGKEFFFQLGNSSVFIGLAIILGYFALLDGPLGKGKTIGKALLNITVRNYDVQLLEPGAAFLRSVICLNVFVLSVLIGVTFKQIDTPEQMFILNLFSAFIWGFLIANSILIGVHPLKQGIHDLLTQTLVSKVGFADRYTAFKESLPEFQRWQVSAFQSAAIGFIVMVILASILNYKATFNQDEQERLRLFREVSEKFQIPGFELVAFNAGFLREVPLSSTQTTSSSSQPPSPATPEQKNTSGKQEQQRTKEIRPEDLKYTAVFFYRTYHSFDEKQIKTSEEIKQLMLAAREWVKQNLPERPLPADPRIAAQSRKAEQPSQEQSSTKPQPVRKPEKIYFIFEKRINLTFLYQYADEIKLELDVTN
ncbi:MAG: RDD family protein [Candidatus Sumerlaeia bacterium]|nr:RDD family protein [Candidatus Sumerlaeia bacterium]